MDILKQNKSLFIGLIVVIIAFIGYGFVGGSTASTSVKTIYTNTGQSPIEQETLSLLRDIESVELNGAVLSDPAFAVLRDFSRAIVDEPRERDNPFAPINLDELSASTTVITQ